MYEGAVQDLIDELGRLPGVGPKSAQRIAFHLLQADPADVERLAHALTEVKLRVRFCEVCFNVAEAERCRVCLDPRRDPHAICVVEEPKVTETDSDSEKTPWHFKLMVATLVVYLSWRFIQILT